MADVIESDSSSDESLVNSYFALDESSQGLKCYQFEPRKQDIGQSSSSSEKSESDSSADDETVASPNRLAELGMSPSWCRCTKCSTEHLIRERECLCCHEKASLRDRAANDYADDSLCIVNNADFRTLCLTHVVLRNVLVGLNNIRVDNWAVNPAENSGMRYAAYRQFSWWTHGKMGPGKRRVIPSCVTHAIRQEFPKTAEETYTGFLSGEEDSD